ncbi:MAG: hypothetical protein JXR96_21875 [Deltaproteobacteria bacterium]|nr:hypothetical protein [Deltaproteobacteria bacterium]
MGADRLTDLLRDALVAQRASEGFTARTLARLEREMQPAPRRKLRLALAAAALACLLGAVIPLGLYGHKQAEKAEIRAELSRLRAEYRKLAGELTAMRAQPRWVYLGGTDQADFMVDLNRLEPCRAQSPGR